MTSSRAFSFGVAAFFFSVTWLAAAHARAVAPEPTSGRVLFRDDFSSQSSGWTTRVLPSGAIFAYGSGDYLITPSTRNDDYAGAPYFELHSDIAFSVDVQSAAPGSVNFGAGVVCGRPSVLSAAYLFKVYSNGAWAVLRGSVDAQLTPQTIVDGTLSHGLGETPVTVTAECADRGEVSGGAVTHLAMFVGGISVASLDDTWSALSGTGWRAGLTAGPGTAAPLQTAHFTNFVLREVAPGVSSTTAGSRLPIELIIAALVGLVSIGLIVRRRSKRSRASAGTPSWVPESVGAPVIPPGPPGDPEPPPRPDG